MLLEPGGINVLPDLRAIPVDVNAEQGGLHPQLVLDGGHGAAGTQHERHG